jgi:hypothetical protein
VGRAEAELAYGAAAEALGLILDVGDLRAMADLTHDVADVFAAVREMRAAVHRHDPGSITLSMILGSLRARDTARRNPGTA